MLIYTDMKYFKRTPVRHYELNPIALIWAEVKGFVAKNNTTFRLKDVKELTYAAFGKITKDVWTKAEEHVVKIEKEYCKERCIDRSVNLLSLIFVMMT